MASTVQDILTAAYSKSAKNRPGHIASESTELLQVVVRTLRRMFALSVKHNLTFYGERKVVAYNGSVGGWPRPSGVQSINRIEFLNGTKIAEVPYDDRKAEEGMPSVYSYGQVFYPAGNTGAGDPGSTDSLVLFCSSHPTALAALGDTLDPRWPEDFNELLILKVARYLAIKEGGRGDDVAAYDDEYKEWLADYVDFLFQETTTLVRRNNFMGNINTRGVGQ